MGGITDRSTTAMTKSCRLRCCSSGGVARQDRAGRRPGEYLDPATGADLVRTPQFVHNTRSSAGIAPEFINCLTTLDRVAVVGLRAPAVAKT